MWASALAVGVTDEVFQRTTPKELRVLVRRIGEARRATERAMDMRAGLVAAAVMNTTRTKKSDKLWQPGDFFAEEVKILSTEEMVSAMTAFAEAHNRTVRA